MSDRRPYTAKIGMDALVERADGSTINFGDAIYHADNSAEAQAYATPPALDAIRAVLDARCRCGKVSAEEILAALSTGDET